MSFHSCLILAYCYALCSLPSTSRCFEVLDCGSREKSAPEKCRHLETKSFLQLHSHTSVAKPLTGSLEWGASLPDYLKSQMILINWILKGRVFLFSSTVAERVLVQAAQIRETQILFLSSTDLWESTQNYLSFLCLMVHYLKKEALLYFCTQQNKVCKAVSVLIILPENI